MSIDLINLPRWTFASVSKHFDARKATEHLFIEGQDRLTNKERDWLELRMDGPFVKEVSSNFFFLDIEINVLISATMNETDYHVIHTLVGIAAAAFTNQIQAFKLGDRPQDDQTLLGCYLLRTEGREAVIISHFGMIDSDKRLVQASVEGHYRLELEGS